jgi:Flp pilus assembly protein TadB
MLRLVFSALVASALVLIPAAFTTQYSDQARAEATENADKAKTTTKKKKRELTKGQKAFRERQRQCGAEWREAKKAGKLEKGVTWPKFLSACNTRLKGKS